MICVAIFWFARERVQERDLGSYYFFVLAKDNILKAKQKTTTTQKARATAVTATDNWRKKTNERQTKNKKNKKII
jgi:hypothetical protein